MSTTIEVNPRSRAGSFDVFERRYRPITNADDAIMRDWNDPLIKQVDERQVWSVVDCDGTLYLSPGFATVNYMGRVVTEHRWSDTEFSNPGYVY